MSFFRWKNDEFGKVVRMIAINVCNEGSEIRCSSESMKVKADFYCFRILKHNIRKEIIIECEAIESAMTVLKRWHLPK